MLDPEEHAELRELLAEHAAELVALTADADAATLERTAVYGPLRLLAPDAPAGAAEVMVDALEAQGPPAADLLDAVASLAPAALAQRARAALARTAAAPRPRTPLRATEAAAVRLPGADIYLLRIDRDGPDWHAAHLIVEGDPGRGVLAAASIANAEPNGELRDVAADLDPGGVAAVEAADLDEVRAQVRTAAANARSTGAGLSAETVTSLPLIGAALGIEAEAVCGLVLGGGPSTLVVGPDDDDRFAEILDDLLEAFGPWLRDADRPMGAGLLTAEVMLTYKWLEGDGDLARWTEPDLAQLLLDYVPREVLVDDMLLSELVPAAADFLAFLDERALLAGEPLPELLDACAGLEQPFADAFTTAPSTGPADALVRAMIADGVDLSDEGQVQAWVARYNAGSQADRERITGKARRGAGRSRGKRKRKRR